MNNNRSFIPHLFHPYPEAILEDSYSRNCHKRAPLDVHHDAGGFGIEGVSN